MAYILTPITEKGIYPHSLKIVNGNEPTQDRKEYAFVENLLSEKAIKIYFKKVIPAEPPPNHIVGAVLRDTNDAPLIMPNTNFIVDTEAEKPDYRGKFNGRAFNLLLVREDDTEEILFSGDSKDEFKKAVRKGLRKVFSFEGIKMPARRAKENLPSQEESYRRFKL